jgi:hypothetical protein
MIHPRFLRHASGAVLSLSLQYRAALPRCHRIRKRCALRQVGLCNAVHKWPCHARVVPVRNRAKPRPGLIVGAVNILGSGYIRPTIRTKHVFGPIRP